MRVEVMRWVYALIAWAAMPALQHRKAGAHTQSEPFTTGNVSIVPPRVPVAKAIRTELT